LSHLSPISVADASCTDIIADNAQIVKRATKLKPGPFPSRRRATDGIVIAREYPSRARIRHDETLAGPAQSDIGKALEKLSVWTRISVVSYQIGVLAFTPLIKI